MTKAKGPEFGRIEWKEEVPGEKKVWTATFGGRSYTVTSSTSDEKLRNAALKTLWEGGKLPIVRGDVFESRGVQVRSRFFKTKKPVDLTVVLKEEPPVSKKEPPGPARPSKSPSPSPSEKDEEVGAPPQLSRLPEGKGAKITYPTRDWRSEAAPPPLIPSKPISPAPRPLVEPKPTAKKKQAPSGPLIARPSHPVILEYGKPKVDSPPPPLPPPLPELPIPPKPTGAAPKPPLMDIPTAKHGVQRIAEYLASLKTQKGAQPASPPVATPVRVEVQERKATLMAPGFTKAEWKKREHDENFEMRVQGKDGYFYTVIMSDSSEEAQREVRNYLYRGERNWLGRMQAYLGKKEEIEDSASVKEKKPPTKLGPPPKMFAEEKFKEGANSLEIIIPKPGGRQEKIKVTVRVR